MSSSWLAKKMGTETPIPSSTEPGTPAPDESIEELLIVMNNLSAQIERLANQQRDWRISFRNGILAGLGGVIGATLVVSILVSVLQPFKRLEAFGPMIERLDSTLRKSSK